MSTNPQLRAYYDNDHLPQKERIRLYVKSNSDKDANEIGKALGLPPGRVTARLSELQATGEVVGYDLSDGSNTRYYVPESEALGKIKANEYNARNHWVTKFAKKVEREGLLTNELKTELLTLYYALQ